MSETTSDGGRIAIFAALIIFWVVWPIVLCLAPFSSTGSIVVAVGLCILWVFSSIVLCCSAVAKLFPNWVKNL